MLTKNGRKFDPNSDISKFHVLRTRAYKGRAGEKREYEDFLNALVNYRDKKGNTVLHELVDFMYPCFASNYVDSDSSDETKRDINFIIQNFVIPLLLHCPILINTANKVEQIPLRKLLEKGFIGEGYELFSFLALRFLHLGSSLVLATNVGKARYNMYKIITSKKAFTYILDPLASITLQFLPKIYDKQKESRNSTLTIARRELNTLIGEFHSNIVLFFKLLHSRVPQKNFNGIYYIVNFKDSCNCGVLEFILLNKAFMLQESEACKIAKVLFKNGYSINNADTMFGITLLMAAAATNRLQFVEVLVRGGASLNIRDRDGRTALMYAVHNRALDVANYLIDSGANVNIVDSCGRTALHVALSNDMNKLVNKLIQYSNSNLSSYFVSDYYRIYNHESNFAVIGSQRSEQHLI